MHGFTRWLRAFTAAITLSLVSAGAFAQAPVAGKDYVPVTPPQPTENAKKVEVIEFFSYACPHCATLEGPLEAWLKKKPADVEFKRVPTVFHPSWAPYAQLYYTLEAMNLVDKLHGEVFKALHQQNMKFQDAKAMADWAASKGVDRKKFTDAYNSFAVQSRTKLSNDMSRRYAVEFTPAIVVNGRFLTGPSMTSTGNNVDFNRFFAVLDQLIATSRKGGGK
ncbi:MAG TPA: thiol:disulfide interchange protein DsbA/DsbL [Burkholderiales bacterium]|nr:thiol:disulfide interchange protein DsbA/DsbL [Burkholderiales bacterium]